MRTTKISNPTSFRWLNRLGVGSSLLFAVCLMTAAAGLRADAGTTDSSSAAAGMATAETPVPTAVATPSLVQWTGFLQDWATLGEQTGNGVHSYTDAGDYLKHFQVGFTANPYPGVSLVTLSELAAQSVSGTGAVVGGTYGITLLNAYIKADLSRFTGSMALPLTLTAGQFKTHFGLNRMYRADKLVLVDYSSIYNGATGVFGSNASYAPYWDDGLQLAWQHGSLIEADAAWVNGEGPNLGAPSTAVLGEPDQEYVGNVTVSPCKLLSVGASYLYGEFFSTPGTVGFPNKPKTFTDEYSRFELPGKSFAAEVEFLNRSGNGSVALPATITDGADRNGLTVTLSQYLCDPIQLAFGYDRVIVYGYDSEDSTRYIGGVNWYPRGPLRFSLQQMAKASGVSERAGSSWTILQSQVGF